MGAGFEIEGIDEFTNNLELIQKVFPDEVKKFMRAEGNKLKKVTKGKASIVNKKTGNLLEGVKRGKFYKFDGKGAIRVYAGSPARHGHWLEYGHRMVGHLPDKKDSGLYVRGFRIFRSAASSFEGTYQQDCEKFVDEIMAKLD